jgi:hypothetical protein
MSVTTSIKYVTFLACIESFFVIRHFFIPSTINQKCNLLLSLLCTDFRHIQPNNSDQGSYCWCYCAVRTLQGLLINISKVN